MSLIMLKIVMLDFYLFYRYHIYGTCNFFVGVGFMVQLENLSVLYDNKFFICYKIDSIKSWTYLNISDFYKWISKNDAVYFKFLKSRHFFFKNNVIFEEYSSSDSSRKNRAIHALNCYLVACYNFNGIQDFSKMIDLQKTSLLFRDAHSRLVNSLKSCIHLPCNDNEEKYFSSCYGRDWKILLDAEANKLNLCSITKICYDCDDVYMGEKLRTMFYDSGSTREMQFDWTVGRENTNGVK